MLTTKKIGTGHFAVLWNDAPTNLEIINGSLGLSGRDTRNVYGIVSPGKPPRWIGSLAACKKTAAVWLKKREG